MFVAMYPFKQSKTITYGWIMIVKYVQNIVFGEKEAGQKVQYIKRQGHYRNRDNDLF